MGDKNGNREPRRGWLTKGPFSVFFIFLYYSCGYLFLCWGVWSSMPLENRMKPAGLASGFVTHGRHRSTRGGLKSGGEMRRERRESEGQCNACEVDLIRAEAREGNRKSEIGLEKTLEYCN
jgi:hypothetical protein